MIAKQYCNSTRRQGISVKDASLGVILTWVGTQGLAVTDCDLGPVKELLSQRAPVSSFILQECLNLSRPLRSFKNRIKFLKSI